MPKNEYIDVNDLNKNLKSLTQKYPTANYIDMKSLYKLQKNSYYSTQDLVFKINIEIEYLNYKTKFIDNIKLLKNNTRNSHLRKGTIPYLFHLQINKKIAVENNTKLVKGTIPYLFDQMRFRANQVPKAKNNLFRAQPETKK